MTRPRPARPPVDAESPLAWLRSRRDKSGAAMIEEHAYRAGERLRHDHALALLTARTTMNWDTFAGRAEKRTGGPDGGLMVNEAALAARRRVEAALAAVGPDLAGVLVDVCCELKGLVEIEQARGWPQRCGKVVLRLALEALARHYGLGPEARGPDRGRIRRWGTPDSRPRI